MLGSSLKNTEMMTSEKKKKHVLPETEGINKQRQVAHVRRETTSG